MPVDETRTFAGYIDRISDRISKKLSKNRSKIASGFDMSASRQSGEARNTAEVLGFMGLESMSFLAGEQRKPMMTIGPTNSRQQNSGADVKSSEPRR
jgi:hypothetical protein